MGFQLIDQIYPNRRAGIGIGSRSRTGVGYLCAVAVDAVSRLIRHRRPVKYYIQGIQRGIAGVCVHKGGRGQRQRLGRGDGDLIHWALFGGVRVTHPAGDIPWRLDLPPGVQTIPSGHVVSSSLLQECDLIVVGSRAFPAIGIDGWDNLRGKLGVRGRRRSCCRSRSRRVGAAVAVGADVAVGMLVFVAIGADGKVAVAATELEEGACVAVALAGAAVGVATLQDASTNATTRLIPISLERIFCLLIIHLLI